MLAAKVVVNAWKVGSDKDAYYTQFGLAVTRTRQQGGLKLDSGWTMLYDKIRLEFES